MLLNLHREFYRQFDKTSARQVKKHLENNGIKFHLENTVVKAQSKGKHITGVTLKDGKTLKCDLVFLQSV